MLSHFYCWTDYIPQKTHWQERTWGEGARRERQVWLATQASQQGPNRGESGMCAWHWKSLPISKENVRHNCWTFREKLKNSNLVHPFEHLWMKRMLIGSRTQTSNDVFLTDDQEIFHRAAQVLNSSSWHQKKPGSQKASICLWPCLILEFSFS